MCYSFRADQGYKQSCSLVRELASSALDSRLVLVVCLALLGFVNGFTLRNNMQRGEGTK